MRHLDLATIIGDLQKNGHRITRGRTLVLQALLRSKKPKNALELHADITAQQSKINPVTVYRELSFFAEKGIAHMVHLNDGIRRYEIAPSRGHRHHVVCTSCKAVEDVEMGCHGLHAMERTISAKKNFIVQGHALEFYGLCSRCS